MVVDPKDLEQLSQREWEIAHTAYSAALETLGRFEETTDRRVQVLLATVSVAGVALGLAVEAGADATLWVAAGASVAVGFIGLFTLIRVVKLIVTSQRLKLRVAFLGCSVAGPDSVLRKLMVYDPYKWPEGISQGWLPTRGSRVDLIAGTTAMAFGSASGLILSGLGVAFPRWLVIVIAVLIAVGIWYDQIMLIRREYSRVPSHPAA